MSPPGPIALGSEKTAPGPSIVKKPPWVRINPCPSQCGLRKLPRFRLRINPDPDLRQIRLGERTRNINYPEGARGRIAGQGTQWNRHHADGDESSRICLESFHLSIPSERSQSLPTSASSAAADKSIRTTFFTQSGWRRWILV